MKIYFTAAISQKDKFDNYSQIIQTLKKIDPSVQHKHITDQTIELIQSETDDQRVDYYKFALKQINKADIIVIEASFPSTLNIGHEISVALEKGKPVIVLYKTGYDSFFLHGLKSDKLILVEYDDEDLTQLLEEAIQFAKDQSDTRFNFFIGPNQLKFLDDVSKQRRIPRSVFLRRLIEADMQKNPDYSGQ